MPSEVTPRRFPPPWSLDGTDACFIVRDRNGHALPYVYFGDEPGRRFLKLSGHVTPCLPLAPNGKPTGGYHGNEHQEGR